MQVRSIVLVDEDWHRVSVNMKTEPLGGFISVCFAQPQITGSMLQAAIVVDASYD